MATKAGGKREGAGRPRTAASVMRDNKIVERKLKLHAEQGWEVLADAYPNLMRAAVKAALGDETRIPNVAMLRTLLELMVKVVGSEPDQGDSAIKQLVSVFIDRVKKADGESDRSPVESDRSRLDDGVDGGLSERSTTDTAIPRMDPRI